MGVVAGAAAPRSARVPRAADLSRLGSWHLIALNSRLLGGRRLRHRLAGGLGHLEPVQPLGTLVEDLDAVDARSARPLAAELDEPLDVIRIAF